MFNLEALINSFGLNFFSESKNVKTKRENFNLYEMIVAIYGEVKLAKEPNYNNTQMSKSINIINKEGKIINIVYKVDPFENDRTIIINYNDKDNKHHISINSETGLKIDDESNLIITKDNQIEYYSEESISAYKALSGSKEITAESDFKKYCISPDASCKYLQGDDANDKWENRIGSFIRDNINSYNKTPQFNMEELIDTVTNNIFERFFANLDICSFSASSYCKVLYDSIGIKDNGVKASYKNEEYEDHIEKGIDLLGHNPHQSYDTIHISSNFSTIDENEPERTIEMLIEMKNSKLYTTIFVNQTSCRFISKLIQDNPADALMSDDRCAIICGDLNGARYYNERTIADYSKIREVAFKVEIANDDDFSDYFVEADDMVEFDETLPLDIQLGQFTKIHFFSKEYNKTQPQQLIKEKHEE